MRISAKKGQATLFIIIAIVIVAAALFGILYFRMLAPLPRETRNVENYLQDCAALQIKEAAKTAELQGGYLELPAFEEGSSYMPFSSQLSFLGMDVPYWFYISGNNIAKEQKPSLEQIEEQLANYVNEHIRECRFDSFTSKGYSVETQGEPITSVTIKASSIDATVRWPLTVTVGEKKTSTTEHKISAKSQFGNIYDTAEKIFDAEQKGLFLENYSIDVLRLYAPVDGIELSCAPKTWQVDKVKQDLVSALEANIAAIKAKGNYYSISDENKYFETDVGKNVAENVYFSYNRNMPTKFEVWPADNGIMRADPIGKQEGLGILSAVGFCYVPYHFVYDVSFPVLVQISSGDELFQFPMLVVISKSQARNAEEVEETAAPLDICQFKAQNITVFTYDENSKPLEAELYYKCFNNACPLGTSEIKDGKAVLKAAVPQCYNGILIARAENYSDAKVIASSVESFSANIFMKPKHILKLDPGIGEDENAIITFASNDQSISAYWPEQKEVELVAGDYNVTAQVFKETSITLPSQQGEQCVKVPADGIAGMLGAMREECIDLDIPADTLTAVLFGGGKASIYLTEAQLDAASQVKLTIPEFDVPTDLNGLSEIYGMLETSQLGVEVK
jgi:hypothetical protein